MKTQNESLVKLDIIIKSKLHELLEQQGLANYKQNCELVIQNLPMFCSVGYELTKSNNLTLYVKFAHQGERRIEFNLGIIHDPNCDIEKGIGELVKLLGYLNQIRRMGTNAEDLSIIPFTFPELCKIAREMLYKIKIPGWEYSPGSLRYITPEPINNKWMVNITKSNDSTIDLYFYRINSKMISKKEDARYYSAKVGEYENDLTNLNFIIYIGGYKKDGIYHLTLKHYKTTIKMSIDDITKYITEKLTKKLGKPK